MNENTNGRMIAGVASPLGVIRAMIGDGRGDLVKVIDGKVKAVKASGTPVWIRQALSDDRDSVIASLHEEAVSGRVRWEDSLAAGLLDIRLVSLTGGLMCWDDDNVKLAAYAIDAIDDSARMIEGRGGNWKALLQDDYERCLALYNAAYRTGMVLGGRDLMEAIKDILPSRGGKPKGEIPVQAGLFGGADLGALD